MRAPVCTALAFFLSAGTLAAAEVGPLSPGKPAGVKAAQYEGDPTLLIVLGAAIIIGIIVAASDNGHDHGGNNNGGTPSTGTA